MQSKSRSLIVLLLLLLVSCGGGGGGGGGGTIGPPGFDPIAISFAPPMCTVYFRAPALLGLEWSVPPSDVDHLRWSSPLAELKSAVLESAAGAYYAEFSPIPEHDNGVRLSAVLHLQAGGGEVPFDTDVWKLSPGASVGPDGLFRY